MDNMEKAARTKVVGDILEGSRETKSEIPDKLPLIPFLLEGVAGTSEMQRDGLHPTPRGYAHVERNVMKVLEPLQR
jgi:lysophospholipase L1-like esterase